MARSPANANDPAVLSFEGEGGWGPWADYGGVFLSAFLLRVFHILDIRSDYPFFSHLAGDAASYNDWGRRIAEGNWLGPSVFYQDPLYPYFLGVFYKIFGYSPESVRWIQIVVGSLTCLLIYDTARRLFNRRIGLCAGLIAAGYGSFIFHEGMLLKEAFSVFFSSSLLWFLILTQQKISNLSPAGGIEQFGGTGETPPYKFTPLLFFTGVWLGLLVLTRGNALLLVPGILFWLFLFLKGRTSWKFIFFGSAAFILGTILVMSPSALHNFYVGKDFVLTTSQAGSNFYIGNHKGATGFYIPLVPAQQTPEFEGQDARLIAELKSGRKLKPSEISRYWFRRTWADIQMDVGAWLFLLASKADFYMQAYEVPDYEDIYVARRYSWVLRLPLFGFGLVFPLAVMGVFLSFRHWKRLLAVHIFILINAFSVILFYLMARYRLPTVPPLIIMAGFSAWALSEWVRRRDYRRWVPAAAAVGLLVANGYRWQKDMNQLSSTSLTNLGIHYLENKQNKKALELLEEALKFSPNSAEVQNIVGNALHGLNALDLAIERYQIAIRLNPQHTGALYHLGAIYFRRGDYKRARENWERVLSITPTHQLAREALKQWGHLLREK